MTNIPLPEVQLPKKIIEAERLLFETIREYISHFWKYLGTAALVMVPLSVLIAWFDMFNFETRNWWRMIPFAVLIGLISFYLRIAMLYLTRELYARNSPRIKTAYLTAVSLYLPFLLTEVLNSIAFLSGLILCIIPGIIVFVWFYIADGIVVWEGKSGIAALQRSRELTKPFFFRVLWIIILFALVSHLLYVVLSYVPSWFVPNLPVPYSFSRHLIPSPLWYTLYRELVSVFILPMNVIMTYILYWNLREVNEVKKPKLELPLNI